MDVLASDETKFKLGHCLYPWSLSKRCTTILDNVLSLCDIVSTKCIFIHCMHLWWDISFKVNKINKIIRSEYTKTSSIHFCPLCLKRNKCCLLNSGNKLWIICDILMRKPVLHRSLDKKPTAKYYKIRRNILHIHSVRFCTSRLPFYLQEEPS